MLSPTTSTKGGYQTILTVLTVCIIAIFTSCGSPHPKADLVIYNANIHTLNAQQPNASAVAVTAGKIVYVGNNAEAKLYIGEGTNQIDLGGQLLTPGWIESHGHFMGMGNFKMNLDLTSINNYDDMVQMVAEAAKEASPGEWITGRGWHQSKWDKMPDTLINGFPTHDRISAVSPNNPVYLKHASGHAGFANAKAMELAGVNRLSVESLNSKVEGGEIIKDELGNPTGVFTERASALVGRLVPEDTEERAEQALNMAIQECLEKGITSFHDAGSGQDFIDRLQRFKEQDKLGIRMYVMLSSRQPALLENWYERGPMIDPDHMVTVRSIKLHCDGALGPRGAWLLRAYSDRPGHFGHETLPMEIVSTVSEKGLELGFQVCSHAIGDRANREVLDRYEAAFKKFPENNDHRFRIEHAQHLHPDDISRFGELGVIAAMQAIHMSSDRPWAINRLGRQRIIDGAYVWQSLLQSGAVIINGTDAPVEPVDQLPSFYASVSRKTLEGLPEGGYEPDQAMTREQALRSFTIDAAFGEFDEDFKGSIELGKAADFTVLDKDIMTIPEMDILKTKVQMTIVGGKVLYQAK